MYNVEFHFQLLQDAAKQEALVQAQLSQLDKVFTVFLGSSLTYTVCVLRDIYVIPFTTIMWYFWWQLCDAFYDSYVMPLMTVM